MKYDKPVNDGYAATVVAIRSIAPLANCENVVSTTIFGYTAIVGKDTKVGDVGIVFPAETQLSDDYCKNNSLYRHGDLNADPTKKGYLEDSRRVRSIKFRGNTSSCLFMPLESLAYLGMDPRDFEVGDTFDKIRDQEICKKYEVLVSGRMKGLSNLPKRPTRVEQKHIPEHVDTLQWLRHLDKVDPEDEVTVTAKWHGTSIRAGHTIVKRKLSVSEKVAKFLGLKVQEWEFAYVFGSRKVIKDPNSPTQKHYYEASDGVDLWNLEGKKLDGLLPKNCVIYGEILGYTPTGKAIQEGYTYGFAEKTCGLYIYRVTFVNEDGNQVDLSYDQLRLFCRERGLNNVVEIWRGKAKDFKPEEFLDKRFRIDLGLTQCLPLSDDKTVDEGVVLRIEGVIPRFFKVKSPDFYEWETEQLDKNVADMEYVGCEGSDGQCNSSVL